MTRDAELVNRIREWQWRQGTVLPTAITDAAGDALPADFGAADWGIVISQSCDIVHQHKTRAFENEPYVEVLIARPWTGKKPDSAFVAGRNARRILFTGHDTAQGPVQLQAGIHDRYRLDRRRLAQAGPSASRILHDKTRQLLIQWVGKRYLRPGYPDGLNIGAAPSNKALKALLARHRAIIHSTWMGYEVIDTEPHARYRLTFLVAIDQDHVSPQWAAQCSQLQQALRAAWQASHRQTVPCPWHETLESATLEVDVEVLQAEQLSVQRISEQQLIRYDVDWITYDSETDELPFRV